MCLEKISLHSEEEKELGIQLGSENNMRMSLGNREFVCFLHGLAGCMSQCKMDQINADHAECCY
jgi:hypothetical protein